MPPKRKATPLPLPSSNQNRQKRARTISKDRESIYDTIEVDASTSEAARPAQKMRGRPEVPLSAVKPSKSRKTKQPADPKDALADRENGTSRQRSKRKGAAEAKDRSEDQLSRPATSKTRNGRAVSTASGGSTEKGALDELKIGNGNQTRSSARTKAARGETPASTVSTKDVYDLPSDLEDELSKPTLASTRSRKHASATRAPKATSSRPPQRTRRKPTITYKTPSRSHAGLPIQDEQLSVDSDDKSHGLSSREKTTTRVTRNCLESSGVPPEETPRNKERKRSIKVPTNGVNGTPKTPATVGPVKPPRTRKKGMSEPPKSKLAAKMGIGVPGEAGEATPSRRRGTTVEKAGNDAEDDEVGVQDDEQAETEPEVSEEKAKGCKVVPRRAEDARARMEKAEEQVDTDLDVDVVTNGVIVPATQAPRRPSARKAKQTSDRPSLGTEGLKDPFAIPDGGNEVGVDDEVVKSSKRTPKKLHSVKKETAKSISKVPAQMKEKGTTFVPTQQTVDLLKRRILAKLMRRERLPLVGVDEEFDQVFHLLEQTVAAGEGNSMLIIGARGSGKTTLVETALSDLKASHGEEFHVVRLNGFLQTDDKLAVREIWRQLGVEMSLSEDTEAQPKTTNFADTLASILAVLSHPDELGTPPPANAEVDGETEARTTKSVVFVLDEFDLFALHARQTLLYNLFDIAQAKKAPIAVIGLTCKVDVVDSLEKRVKSRFSHRSLHLRLPADIDAFWSVCREGLRAPEDGAVEESAVEKYFDQWNQWVDELPDNPSFSRLLRRTYAHTKTPHAIFNTLLLPLSIITPSAPFPSLDSLDSFAPPASILSLVPSGLTDIQLSLLIAAARLEVFADMDAVSFDMVYEEYLALCTRTRVQATPSGGGIGRVWGKDVGKAAWEGLEACGLLVRAGEKRAGALWRVEVGLEEVRRCVQGTAWAKWCKEVV